MEYRIQSTGEVKTQGEVRRMHSNTSLPKVWDANVCTALGIDPVLAAPKPDTTGYTQASVTVLHRTLTATGYRLGQW
jgi:hypothetical protein